MRVKYLYIIIIVTFFSFKCLNAENENVSFKSGNRVFHEDIFTVQMHLQGDRLEPPVIHLNGSKRLQLEFDLLADQSMDLSYRIFHCDHQWKKSQIDFNDYAEGYQENPIMNIQHSQNTTVPFHHYTLELPNQDIRINASGNYVVIVYNEETGQPVLSRRFFVLNEQVRVQPKIHRPDIPSFAEEYQEVDFSLEQLEERVMNPDQDLYVVVAKNGNWSSAKKGLKPTQYKGPRIIYDHQESNLFPGGKEFRYFNSRNIKYAMENIRAVEYQSPHYHFYLERDQDWTFKDYKYYEDLNGRFFIEGKDKEQRALTADYVFVHFELKVDYPVAGEGVYLFGAMTDWQAKPQWKMTYDFNKKIYHGTFLLKQGYYNYRYVMKEKGDRGIDHIFFSGSDYQTENDYVFYIYNKSLMENYVRLVGYHKVNTLNRIRQ